MHEMMYLHVSEVLNPILYGVFLPLNVCGGHFVPPPP